MAYKEAHEFFIREISTNPNVQFPIKYDLNRGNAPGSAFFRVVIMFVPEQVPTQKANLGEAREQTISFAPAGGCPCCGRK